MIKKEKQLEQEKVNYDSKDTAGQYIDELLENFNYEQNFDC